MNNLINYKMSITGDHEFNAAINDVGKTRSICCHVIIVYLTCTFR